MDNWEKADTLSSSPSSFSPKLIPVSRKLSSKKPRSRPEPQFLQILHRLYLEALLKVLRFLLLSTYKHFGKKVGANILLATVYHK